MPRYGLGTYGSGNYGDPLAFAALAPEPPVDLLLADEEADLSLVASEAVLIVAEDTGAEVHLTG